MATKPSLASGLRPRPRRFTAINSDVVDNNYNVDLRPCLVSVSVSVSVSCFSMHAPSLSLYSSYITVKHQQWLMWQACTKKKKKSRRNYLHKATPSSGFWSTARIRLYSWISISLFLLRMCRMIMWYKISVIMIFICKIMRFIKWNQ